MLLTNGAKYNSIQIVDTTLGVVYFGDFIIEKDRLLTMPPLRVVIYKGWRIRYVVGYIYSILYDIIRPGAAPFAIKSTNHRVLDSNNIEIMDHNRKYVKIAGNLSSIMNVNLICGGLRRDAYFDGEMIIRCGRINYDGLTNIIRIYF